MVCQCRNFPQSYVVIEPLAMTASNLFHNFLLPGSLLFIEINNFNVYEKYFNSVITEAQSLKQVPWLNEYVSQSCCITTLRFQLLGKLWVTFQQKITYVRRAPASAAIIQMPQIITYGVSKSVSQ